MPLLFTYGTLRKSALAEKVLGNEAVLLSQNVSANGYQIYSLGSFPFAVPKQNTECKIIGDIFYITPSSLEFLDNYENVDTGLFERVFDSALNCYIYIKGEKLIEQNAPLIESGNWHDV